MLEHTGLSLISSDHNCGIEGGRLWALRREYRQENKERISNRSKKYYQENKTYLSKYSRQRHKAKPKERQAADSHRWYLKNKERVIAKVTNYRKTYSTKVNKTVKLLKAEKIARGQCLNCSKLAVAPGARLCESHWYKSIAARHYFKDPSIVGNLLQKKLQEQECKCPYTGEVIIPGVNCWLDHILPRSRFPELANDINNVEWVSEKANKAKGAMTKEEFLDFCRKVSRLHPVDELKFITMKDV